MQKFGLDSFSGKRHSALEFEIVKEQASALGIAGRKLNEALERYYRSEKEQSEEDLEDLLNDVVDKVWGLLLQREFLGFLHDNVDWISKKYNIPEAVFKRLGASR